MLWLTTLSRALLPYHSPPSPFDSPFNNDKKDTHHVVFADRRAPQHKVAAVDDQRSVRGRRQLLDPPREGAQPVLAVAQPCWRADRRHAAVAGAGVAWRGRTRPEAAHKRCSRGQHADVAAVAPVGNTQMQTAR